MALAEYEELSVNYTYCNLENAFSKFLSKVDVSGPLFGRHPPLWIDSPHPVGDY